MIAKSAEQVTLVIARNAANLDRNATFCKKE
jgi:hypothetical protein